MQIKIIEIFGCTCGNSSYPHEGIRKPELHQKGKLNSYDYEVTKWCCKDMQDAFDEQTIVFGEYDSCGINRDKNVNITKCSPYPEGTFWEETPIRFCPFCAEKIIIKK